MANPNEERTNQNSPIYLKTTLPRVRDELNFKEMCTKISKADYTVMGYIFQYFVSHGTPFLLQGVTENDSTL